jgi:TolB-like protein/Flp pilus assembly protein TadD/class 3 adenylate cyclase
MPSEPSSDVKFEIGHVLFIDIVGYSKGLINEQSDSLQKLKEIVRGTEQFRVAEAEGKLLRLPTGDGGALVFRNSPEAPVLCAMEIAKTLKSHRELRVRMGIHSGPVNEISDLNEQANIAGAGINIAQRVMDCGDAGHILLSRHVAEDLEHYPRWRPCLHELGECEIKHGQKISVVNLHDDQVGNPQRPEKFGKTAEHQRAMAMVSRQPRIVQRKNLAIAVAGFIAIAFAVVLLYFTQRGNHEAIAPQKSIAVLPFENLSADPGNAYFAEGIQDEILTRLSKIADLKVISRTSTQHYKSAPENLPEIAKQLGVANVLEGSVQRSGDAVRVTVQLIRAITDSHLWAETYDRKLIDTFGVESDVAQKIAGSLEAKLSGSEKRAISARPTENSEAYQLFLKGRFFWNKRTGADLHTAANYFEQAIAADTNFAGAYAGLADADLLIPVFGAGAPREFFPQAMTAARRAIELDDTSAEGHTALAQLLMFDFKFPESEHEFRRAIELNPNYATAHHWLGNSLFVTLGRFDEAVKEGQRAVELDPLSLIINADLGSTLMISRRYDEAIAQLRRTLQLDANFGYAHWNLGEALYLKGDFQGAIAECERAAALDDDPEITALLGAAYAKAGRQDKALECLEKLKQIEKQRFVRNSLFAYLYGALGDNASGLNYLAKADSDGETPDTTWIKVDPMFDPLRDEPRFQKLVAKLFPSNSP